MANDTFHIIPVKDQKKHRPYPSCWCKPYKEDELMIHIAADGREFREAIELEYVKRGLNNMKINKIILEGEV